MPVTRSSHWFGGSLTRRLALLFAIILLPPTALSVYFTWETFADHKVRAKLQVRQLASLASTYERKFFDDMGQLLQRLAEQPAIRDQSLGACRSTMANVLDSTREIAGLALYDPQGMPICATSENQTSVKDRDWFHQVSFYRNFTISDYTFAPDSRYPVIVAALPVYGEAGQFHGVLVAAIELYWLTAFMREAALPTDSVFFLLDSNGNVLADRSLYLDNANPALPKIASERPTTNDLRSVVKPDLIQEIANRRLIDFEAVGIDDVPRVYSSVALPHGDVTVLFGMPSAATLGLLQKSFVTQILSIAAIWLMGIGAAWLGTRYLVTRWTAALRRMANAYGRGDYSAKLELTHAPTELRDLGDTLMLVASRIQAREEELKRSLEQKDVLLREIHHRVKNNLQIVTSLLNIHGKTVPSPDARTAIEEIKTRVRALALVHRYLYEGDDVRLVDLRSFMTELCQTVMTSLEDVQRRVALHTSTPDFLVPSDKAIPIALLVTEAMTNALKHAFPGDRTGTIEVRIEHPDPHTVTLTVADNGVGLPSAMLGADSLASAPDSLGFGLIYAFAKQIGSEVVVTSPPGTTIEVQMDAAAFLSVRGRGDSRSPAPGSAQTAA
ncbi:MAG: sensor histidine kinase [Kiloniellales bacterium]